MVELQGRFGEFEVIEHEGGKIVKLPADPIIECGLLFGKSSKNAMTVEAKAFAEKRGRRSFPRFGVGVHGVSGYRVRVVPAAKKLELVHFEEVIHSEPFVWKSGEWCHLKLVLALHLNFSLKVNAALIFRMLFISS